MSNLQLVTEIIRKSEVDFNKLAHIHGAVNFDREASIALQLLKDSPYLMEAAVANPDAFKFAVLNVAAVGLTLSPIAKEAYLIPRKVNQKLRVIFDPSYFGMQKLGQDSGAIQWCQAEVVREKDTFEIPGFTEAPIHKFDPFGDRGEVVGAYCVSRLFNGDFQTVTMPIADIIYIAEKYSEAYKRNSGPWMDRLDGVEMIKKTLIKRGFKSWPKIGNSERIAKAIEISNEYYPDESAPAIAPPQHNDIGLSEIRELLTKLGKSEDEYLKYARTVTKRDLKKLDDLYDVEIDKALIQLRSWLSLKQKRSKHETA